MKLSQLFTKTLREDPADAEVDSHKLLVRAGYIRQVAPGVFTWLPLGLRVLAKVEAIIDEEMQAANCQRVHFPALLPREPYEVTNRWNEYGNNIFRLLDRKSADYLLAPTHEEMFALIAKDMLNSYKDLPLTLYQIQTKYRDEARPRAGLLRGREFVMKDAYSFDLDQDGLQKSYLNQREAYIRIFGRLGLEFNIVQAVSGAMGGSHSEEFLCPTPIGEDTFVVAPSGYAANVEAAEIAVPNALDDASIASLPALKAVNTPNVKSINDVIDYLNGNESAQLDSVLQPCDLLKAVYLTVINPLDFAREVVIVYIPGNRELDIKRAEALFAPAEVEQSTPEDLARYPQLVAGFVGPGVGDLALGASKESAVREFFDPMVFRGSKWVTGGNQADIHRLNVVAGRDFTVDESNTHGFVKVEVGDMAKDGSGALEIRRGVEIGHIFALGDKYTKAFGFTVLDNNGKAVTPLMGSYGIGVTRCLALLAENNHDEKGLNWPMSVTPAALHIVVAAKEDEVYDMALECAKELVKAGVEVILDDRKSVAPGAKFKDAELLGAPYICVFGRGLKDDEPTVEFKQHNGNGQQNVPLNDLVGFIKRVVG